VGMQQNNQWEYLPRPGGKYVGINLDELSGPDFAKIKGKLKNVRDHVLFDSLRFVSATAWSLGIFKLFAVANGQIASVANVAATQYVKTDSDTNLVGNGGQLPSGDFFTVQSIMVKLAVPENENTTPLAGGATINPTPVALAANTGAGGANQVLAMTENVTLKFFVDDTRLYENGTIDYFPQGFGYSGWNGSSQGGLAQNGGVLPRMLARPRHLRELQRFEIQIANTAVITVPIGCRLKVGLWGALYVPVG
jgi:hypothetical protein